MAFLFPQAICCCPVTGAHWLLLMLVQPTVGRRPNATQATQTAASWRNDAYHEDGSLCHGSISLIRGDISLLFSPTNLTGNIIPTTSWSNSVLNLPIHTFPSQCRSIGQKRHKQRLQGPPSPTSLIPARAMALQTTEGQFREPNLDDDRVARRLREHEWVPRRGRASDFETLIQKIIVFETDEMRMNRHACDAWRKHFCIFLFS